MSEKPKKGDYVLATKFKDGNPGDHFAVGFYDRMEDDRHFVVDSNGKQFRHNGFRRVGKITDFQGRWILANAEDLERFASRRNLWAMLAHIQPEKGASEDDTSRSD